MKTNEKVKKAVEEIDKKLEELSNIAEKENDIQIKREKLNRWKARAVKILYKYVSPSESAKFDNKRLTSYTMGAPYQNFRDEVRIYESFLKALKEDIQQHPEEVLTVLEKKEDAISQIRKKKPPISKIVFIIHGHDELNLKRLNELLRNNWHLDTIILTDKPGRGRTLIEKIEQEAPKASYAFAIFTPDDFIEVENIIYAQARPNVIFELGWFYGHLGRERVCVLVKKGTKIPSDLEGIQRVEFEKSIKEKIIDIENELKEAKLI